MLCHILCFLSPYQGKVVEFQLDHVFNMGSKQEDVFREMRDLIVSVIDGFNICIFAYGQVPAQTFAPLKTVSLRIS